MKKRLEGFVISLKNNNTAVVRINSFRIHPKYKKVQKITRKFQVHYELDNLTVGKKVLIEQSRRFSVTKSFIVVESIKLNQ